MGPERAKAPRWKAITVVLILGALILAVWWGMRGSSRGDTPGSDAASGSVGFTRFPVGHRPQVPAVEGQTIDGDDLTLASLRGHVVVLNVWGSWCAPCRAEAPDLAKVSRETASDGVRFIGIDVRDNPAAARAFDRRYKIPYPSFDDQKGKILAAFAGLIPISAVPSTIVVDQSGAVAARIVGRASATTLRGAINDLLERAPGGAPSGSP